MRKTILLGSCVLLMAGFVGTPMPVNSPVIDDSPNNGMLPYRGGLFAMPAQATGGCSRFEQNECESSCLAGTPSPTEGPGGITYHPLKSATCTTLYGNYQQPLLRDCDCEYWDITLPWPDIA